MYKQKKFLLKLIPFMLILVFVLTTAIISSKSRLEILNESPKILREKNFKLIKVTSANYTPAFLPDENFDPARNSYIEKNLSAMTLEQKVGQMFIWKLSGISYSKESEEFLNKLQPGGIILMGDNTSENLPSFTKAIQEKTKIPYFISIDQEGGIVKRIKSDPNPGPQALGKGSDAEVCNSYEKTTNILMGNGVNLNFGVVADIALNKKNYMYQRSFGIDLNNIKNKSSKAIQCSAKLLTTIKHYPGHGNTNDDSHVKIPSINLSFDEWKNRDAIPFAEGVKNNVDFVMVGHIKYPKIDSENPASLSKKHIDTLRQMDFKGVIITDAMDMLAKSGFDTLIAAERAISAGNDILLYVSSPIDPFLIYTHILNKVRSGEISEERINESVRRILAKKYKLTL